MPRLVALLTVGSVLAVEWLWLVAGARFGPFPIGTLSIGTIALPALLALSVIGIAIVVRWENRDGRRPPPLAYWAIGQFIAAGFLFYLAVTNSDPATIEYRSNAPIVALLAIAGAATLPVLARLDSSASQ